MAFICNARLFLRVRRIKPEGVALWQRRRRQRANRRVCEPRLEHSDFDKWPDCCSAVCLSCLRRFRRRGQSRELEARINSRQNHNLLSCDTHSVFSALVAVSSGRSTDPRFWLCAIHWGAVRHRQGESSSACRAGRNQGLTAYSNGRGPASGGRSLSFGWHGLAGFQ